ncbi:hypothetical protein DRJ25_04165 [Candidatus Woesearchaeota archaeon]|nr:MAG: hypothetical protein DRJ25_04165 [Candidatus Woesearchaeota archaeon]
MLIEKEKNVDVTIFNDCSDETLNIVKDFLVQSNHDFEVKDFKSINDFLSVESKIVILQDSKTNKLGNVSDIRKLNSRDKRILELALKAKRLTVKVLMLNNLSQKQELNSFLREHITQNIENMQKTIRQQR